MATFNIENDSVRVEGGKTFIKVTFKAEDGRSISCHHEVESENEEVIKRELQVAADEFEARLSDEKRTVTLETGKDIEYRAEPVA